MEIGIFGTGNKYDRGRHSSTNPDATLERTMIRRAFCLRFSAAILLGISATASLSAHAILVHSQPAQNAKVKGPSVPIVLTFNSRIDQSRSSLTLEAPSQNTAGLRMKKDAPSPEMLLGEIVNAKPGDYKVGWQVLSVDGHITRGQISFQVL